MSSLLGSRNHALLVFLQPPGLLLLNPCCFLFLWFPGAQPSGQLSSLSGLTSQELCFHSPGFPCLPNVESLQPALTPTSPPWAPNETSRNRTELMLFLPQTCPPPRKGTTTLPAVQTINPEARLLLLFFMYHMLTHKQATNPYPFRQTQSPLDKATVSFPKQAPSCPTGFICVTPCA